VQHDTGRIDDVTLRRLLQSREIPFNARPNGVQTHRAASSDLLAQDVQDAAHFSDDQLARKARFQIRQPRQNLVDRREIAQLLLCRHVTMLYRDGPGFQPCYLPFFMDPITVLVISNPTAAYLRLLERLPEPVNIHTGNDEKFLAEHAPEADVILVGALKHDLLRSIFPVARRVRWVHAMWAGVEKLLFPELVESAVPLTNGRGVFKDGLAEFTIASILFFAKDLRRLIRNQEAGRWEQFESLEVRKQVLGIVGYGGIGRESERLARALGMQVHAIRRQLTDSNADPNLDRMFPLSALRQMLAGCDYVLIATPLTEETRGMIGEAELAAMKPSAVLINVGRGPVVVESALIAALEQGRIKGAALDVFDTEPLPSGHPFYRLPNVLLSPHSADHTVGWFDLGMNKFIENFERFRNGQPLENIVDKRAGY